MILADSPLLRYVLSTPLTPLPFFWLLLCTAMLLQWRKKHRPARHLLFTALAWLALISTSPLPDFLLNTLECQYPPLTNVSAIQADSDAPLYIIVLGAGHTSNPALPLTQQLSETVMQRLLEAVRLHQLLPNSKLVTSGPMGRQSESQAAVVRKAAMHFGVSPENIDTLSRTSNTLDEARHFRERFGTGQRVVVVTDAVHIPRAMQCFRLSGLEPIAAPTHFVLKEEKSMRRINLIPESSNIMKMEQVVHEYLGMVWLKTKNDN